MVSRCACGCGSADGCREAAELGERVDLPGLPALGPTDGEPCVDCDDEFVSEWVPAGQVGREVDLPPSDFDDDDAHVTKRIVVGELRRFVRAVARRVRG